MACFSNGKYENGKCHDFHTLNRKQPFLENHDFGAFGHASKDFLNSCISKEYFAISLHFTNF